MKNEKKSAANFVTLDASQMAKINGGYYVDVKYPNGTTKTIWV